MQRAVQRQQHHAGQETQLGRQQGDLTEEGDRLDILKRVGTIVRPLPRHVHPTPPGLHGHARGATPRGPGRSLSYAARAPDGMPALQTWFQLLDTRSHPFTVESREGSSPLLTIALRILTRELSGSLSYSQSYPIAMPIVISATSRKCDGFQSLNSAMARISDSARRA